MRAAQLAPLPSRDRGDDHEQCCRPISDGGGVSKITVSMVDLHAHGAGWSAQSFTGRLAHLSRRGENRAQCGRVGVQAFSVAWPVSLLRVYE
eukprot:5699675-Prymnesium_polylepis.2